MSKRNFYVKDSELDDYQVKVINRKTDGNLVVEGTPGSGKSVLALWKAKQIQKENKGSYLFIVFTKALKQYMMDGIHQIGINENNIMYYHEWRYTSGCASADYIIVDEVQDFSMEEIDLFRSKAKKTLLLYGDSAQQLYKSMPGKNPVSIRDIIYHTNFPSEKLVFNHRLPKKIARVAEYVSNDSDDLENRCRNEGNSKPKILRYNTIDDQFDAIVQLITNGNMDDVGILFSSNQEVEKAYNYLLDNHALQIEAKYENKNNSDSKSMMNLDFTSDNPKLLTYHSAKGLQFENVFLPECACRHQDQRNALYVAMTRSYNGLYIMHSGNLSFFFDDVPSDLYDTSLDNSKIIRL